MNSPRPTICQLEAPLSPLKASRAPGSRLLAQPVQTVRALSWRLTTTGSRNPGRVTPASPAMPAVLRRTDLAPPRLSSHGILDTSDPRPSQDRIASTGPAFPPSPLRCPCGRRVLLVRPAQSSGARLKHQQFSRGTRHGILGAPASVRSRFAHSSRIRTAP